MAQCHEHGTAKRLKAPYYASSCFTASPFAEEESAMANKEGGLCFSKHFRPASRVLVDHWRLTTASMVIFSKLEPNIHVHFRVRAEKSR